ncbi:MAG TPA: ABC transporter permease [Acidimicrobiia bacterium]|nr:ABC transporter permease [Acidimicrobiia bacterium]
MATAPALRVVYHELHVTRRFWRSSVFFFVLTPVLYLGAMGFGLGGLIDEEQGTVEGLTYLQFVAPGLLAAAAMQGAGNDSLWPVMTGMKWMRVFHAMVATPLAPADVFTGTVGWTALRATAGATVFLGVAAAFGAVPSAFGLLAIPAAMLCAAAFAAPLTAYSATQETDQRFPLILRLGILPLFLISGTFFPVSQLPGVMQPLTWLSPLWHAVVLCRGATTGSLGFASAFIHAAILVGCAAAGWIWGMRTFTRRLYP